MSLRTLGLQVYIPKQERKEQAVSCEFMLEVREQEAMTGRSKSTGDVIAESDDYETRAVLTKQRNHEGQCHRLAGEGCLCEVC